MSEVYGGQRLCKCCGTVLFMKGALVCGDCSADMLARAYGRPAPAVPVPVEPTQEMLMAAVPFPEHLRLHHPDDATWESRMQAATAADQMVAAQTYGKMLSAAPSAPAVDAEKVMGLVAKCKRHWLMAGQQSVYGNHLHAAAEQQAADALLAQIRALLTPAAGQGWIPVGERLPERGVDVLVLFAPNSEYADAEVEIAGMQGDDWFAYYGLSGMPDYWMPLPPLPSPPAIANQEEVK